MPPVRSSRRRFLRYGAALTLAAALPPLANTATDHLAAALPGADVGAGLRFADADVLSAQAGRFDAVLVPAYAAATLLLAGHARRLTGAGRPGRAHDPAGAYTLPDRLTQAALLYRTPPGRPSLDDLFAPGALWPDYARLALGLALLRNGRPPDDTHTGHLARAARDLVQARPRLVVDPAAALASGAGEVALALVDLAAPPAAAQLPAEGRLVLEFDWVITANAQASERTEALLRTALAQRPDAFRPIPPGSWTLAPLPASARPAWARAWAEVRALAHH